MDTQASRPSIWERSTVVRLCRWLTGWRGIRRLLIVGAWIGTLIVLVYAVENWRGGRAWSRCREELRARGAELDFQALVPEPIPDDQNFAATPLVMSWFNAPAAERPPDAYGLAGLRINKPPRKDLRLGRRFTDLVSWATALEQVHDGRPSDGKDVGPGPLDAASREKAAPGVLEGLITNESVFAELRSACRRPGVRYPVKYDVEPYAVLLPHLGRIREVCKQLELQACAELAAGRNDKALEDVKLMLCLFDSLKSGPLLIDYLVRIGCFQSVIQPIWEGLAEHRWSEAQLLELQTQLQKCDFVTAMKPALESERAAVLLTIDLVRRNGTLEAYGSSDGSLGKFLVRLAPRGWFDWEKHNYCRLMDVQTRGAFDPAQRRIWPRQVDANVDALQQALSEWALLNHQFAARMLLPALTRVVFKCADAQTTANQAAIACGLERFRLAKGAFPETLEQLAPDWMSSIPRDVLTGEPYHYRRTDRAFVLYSVGWDGKDDNGVPGKAASEKREGDWTWEYASP